jgi:hypothetical protein
MHYRVTCNLESRQRSPHRTLHSRTARALRSPTRAHFGGALTEYVTCINLSRMNEYGVRFISIGTVSVIEKIIQ